jgi:hypothetical protein
MRRNSAAATQARRSRSPPGEEFRPQLRSTASARGYYNLATTIGL